ncbi:hypothetical protein GCM10010371_59330 [Streptomyces subrutilus]|uniref:Uncharacterized protein n=1 Tax=Streptomyces subrutilus TaxID=36818 RepID=A0A918VDS7_9ACTN|nr:hypothetical protein GCM10010371_59330 [Streptomyces subrutilus]
MPDRVGDQLREEQLGGLACFGFDLPLGELGAEEHPGSTWCARAARHDPVHLVGWSHYHVSLTYLDICLP